MPSRSEREHNASIQDTFAEIEWLRARVAALESAETQRQQLDVALQERDELFVRLLAAAKDGIICIDSDYRIVTFNHGAEEIFGYKAEDAAGQSIDILIPEHFRDVHAAQVDAFRASNADARFMSDRREIVGLRKDGTEFPAEASITRIRIDGRICFAAIVRDVTERKLLETARQQSEEELRASLAELQDSRERSEAQSMALVETCEDLAKARDEAVYANHAKSEFLAHMSHEMRSPLNAIIGFSEVLSKQKLGPITPPAYHEYVEDILVSGTHLLDLVNDILDLAKVEAGALEPQDDEIDIADTVGAALRFVKERATRNGVALETTISDALPLLRADERMVKQMLINLLTNAVKFTEAGAKITIAASVDAAGGFVLSVADTGVGIAATDMPKVMQAFGQADNAPAPNVEGTGLGLPLVKSMAETHGGNFELHSEPGVGTIATIRFPPERVVNDSLSAIA